jgi:hypothetical protein
VCLPTPIPTGAIYSTYMSVSTYDACTWRRNRAIVNGTFATAVSIKIIIIIIIIIMNHDWRLRHEGKHIPTGLGCHALCMPPESMPGLLF